MSVFIPPGDGSVCGEAVSAGSASYRSCGSCSDFGWSEDTVYDGLGLLMKLSKMDLVHLKTGKTSPETPHHGCGSYGGRNLFWAIAKP